MTEEEKPMKNNQNITIAIIAIVILLGGVGAYALNAIKPIDKIANNSMMIKGDEMRKARMEAKPEDVVMRKENDAMPKPEGVMTVKSEDSMMSKAGLYANYSVDLLSKASEGNVVLFFNASWCPSCQSTVKDVNANLSKIPYNLTILSVDYDKETALRQKYGITTQHSFVKVDKDGNEIKKSPYGQLKTLENIINFAN